MQIEEIMSKNVQTIKEGVSAEDARYRMQTAGVHHLVVTKENKLTGILSERDLGSRRSNLSIKGKTAGDLMASNVVSIQSNATVRQAANLLRGRLVGCLPVFKQDKLVGIVTVTDLLETIGCGGFHPSQRRGNSGTQNMRQQQRYKH